MMQVDERESLAYRLLLINYSNIGLIQDFLPKQYENAD